jgi:hypothetical protein
MVLFVSLFSISALAERTNRKQKEVPERSPQAKSMFGKGGRVTPVILVVDDGGFSKLWAAIIMRSATARSPR